MDLPVDVRPLNDLEAAALRLIADEFAAAEPKLAALLGSWSVTNSENTGGGFFTALTIDTNDFTAVTLDYSPIGDVWFDIEGMEHGICCLIFFTDGYPTLLEGYSVGDEDTAQINFGSVKFKLRSPNRMLG